MQRNLSRPPAKFPPVKSHPVKSPLAKYSLAKSMTGPMSSGVLLATAIRQRTIIALSVFAALLLAGFLFKSDERSLTVSATDISAKAVDLSAIDQASLPGDPLTIAARSSLTDLADTVEPASVPAVVADGRTIQPVLQDGTQPAPSGSATSLQAVTHIGEEALEAAPTQEATSPVVQPEPDAPAASAEQQLDIIVSDAASVEAVPPVDAATEQNSVDARPNWQSVEAPRVFTDDTELATDSLKTPDQRTDAIDSAQSQADHTDPVPSEVREPARPVTSQQSNLSGISVASASYGTRLRLPDSIRRVPYITGILQPDGFRRAHWQELSREPALDAVTVNDQQFVVILDAGHGGFDPGSVAANGLMEKNLTLDIAKRVRAILEASSDIKVKMTRTDDSGLDRQTRVRVIRESEADAVVSIHLNHLPQPELNVVESFYAGPRSIAESRALLVRKAMQRHPGNFQYIQARRGIDVSFSQDSRRLATALHNRVLSAVRKDNQSAIDAGVREETLFVLTRSYKTGALVELTCLSNGREAERLKSGNYRHQLAEALAQGIIDHVNSLQASTLIREFNLGA